MALLQAHTDDIEIIKYLEQPPSVATLQQLLIALGLPAQAILRRGESEYKAHGFAEADEASVLALLQAHPKVLERPIVVHQDRAVIGRPPENVLDLFS